MSVITKVSEFNFPPAAGMHFWPNIYINRLMIFLNSETLVTNLKDYFFQAFISILRNKDEKGGGAI